MEHIVPSEGDVPDKRLEHGADGGPREGDRAQPDQLEAEAERCWVAARSLDPAGASEFWEERRQRFLAALAKASEEKPPGVHEKPSGLDAPTLARSRSSPQGSAPSLPAGRRLERTTLVALLAALALAGVVGGATMRYLSRGRRVGAGSPPPAPSALDPRAARREEPSLLGNADRAVPAEAPPRERPRQAVAEPARDRLRPPSASAASAPAGKGTASAALETHRGAHGSAGAASPSAGARAETSRIWRSARWGMTVAEVLAAFPEAVRTTARGRQDLPGVVAAASIRRFRVGAHDYGVSFLVDPARRLVAIQLRPAARVDPVVAYDELVTWVWSAHGPPPDHSGEATESGSLLHRARWTLHGSVIDVRGWETAPGSPDERAGSSGPAREHQEVVLTYRATAVPPDVRPER